MEDLLSKISMKKDAIKKFYNFFPAVVNEIVNNPEYKDMSRINELLEKSLYLYAGNEKKLSGEFCVRTFQYFSQKLDFETKTDKAIILAWCVELLKSAMFITENFVKGVKDSTFLNNSLHLYQNTGAFCFNDTLLITGGMYNLLKMHFIDEAIYIPLLKLFRDAQFNQTLGTSLVQNTRLEDFQSLQHLNLQRFYTIVKSTSEISFYLPVASAMQLVNVTNPNVFAQVKTFCLKLGLLNKLKIDNDNQIALCWENFTLYESWTFYAVLQYGTLEQKRDFLDSLDEFGFVKENQNIPKIISQLKLYTRLNNTIGNLEREICESIDQMQVTQDSKLFKILHETLQAK